MATVDCSILSVRRFWTLWGECINPWSRSLKQLLVSDLISRLYSFGCSSSDKYFGWPSLIILITSVAILKSTLYFTGSQRSFQSRSNRRASSWGPSWRNGRPCSVCAVVLTSCSATYHIIVHLSNLASTLRCCKKRCLQNLAVDEVEYVSVHGCDIYTKCKFPSFVCPSWGRYRCTHRESAETTRFSFSQANCSCDCPE